jgi:hypothetical protein
VQALGALGGGLQKNLAASLGATNHGGVTVHLASSHPQVLLAPDATTAGSSSIDVFVANGSTQVPFHVQGEDWQDGVSSPVTATITVSAPGFANGSNTIDYVQPTLDIQLLATTTTSLTGNDPFIVRVGVPNAGNTGLAQLQNRRFGGTPLVVTVANSNAPVAEIDQHGGVNGAQSQTPQIAAGQATTPNNVAGGVEFDPISPGTTIVSVSIPGFAGTVTASVSVTVTGAGITVPGLAAVGGGLQVAYIGTLGASNHGGVSVHVESSDPTRVLVAPNATTVGTTSIDVTVLNGATQFPFVLQGVDWTDPTSTEAPVTITASAPGFSNGSNSVSYQKPVVEILLLIVTTTALSPNDAFGVRVGTRNAGGNELGTQQNRRFGAPALVVTVTNSNATVAEIDLNGANGAQTQTSQIVAGQATTPSSGANSLEFDPLGTGTTTVSASIPNFFALPGASPAVVVNTPVISVPALGSVGGGLQAGAFTVSLGGATEHGVMTLHLVSSDPTRILLAPNLTTPGDSSGTLDLPVAAGANQAQFVVQALDWVDGVSTAATVTVTASAPGFTSDSNSVSYVQPAVELSTLVTTISSTAANDDFVVRVGVPNAFNTAVSSPQPRRAGGSTLVVGVTNSNATVAELDQNGGLNGAQSQTANIAAGQSTTPLNTAGGVEFDPLTPGSTTVAVSPLAGFIPVASATQNVTVNP